MKYKELAYDTQCDCDGVFFAFSEKQFSEGLEELGVARGDVYSCGYGMYATNEGATAWINFYTDLRERIKRECTPEEIFKFEFWNHECGYTYDIEDALEIVQGYFPEWQPSRELLNKLFAEGEE